MKWYEVILAVSIGAVIAFLLVALAVKLDGFVKRSDKALFVKRVESGYEVYKHNELMYEFTTQNTDSASLHTLKMIYEGD